MGTGGMKIDHQRIVGTWSNLIMTLVDTYDHNARGKATHGLLFLMSRSDDSLG
jgi:hypothetical protein